MRRFLNRSVIVVPLVVFVASAALGVAAERWYAKGRLEAEHERVKAELLPFANTVAASVGRHASQMGGLRAFVESRSSLAQLEHEFDLYAAGLVEPTTGIRAIQVVRDGRILKVFPLLGNEESINLNLRESERRNTREGYARARESDSITVFGPAELVQGGKALVIDQRVKAPYDPKLDFVAMLLELNSVIKDMKLDSQATDLVVSVRDPKGGEVGKTNGVLPQETESVRALVRDGDWHVLGAPRVGWQAAIAPQLFPVRVAIVAIVILLTILSRQVTGRAARLVAAVEERTASLRKLADERSETIQRQARAEDALAASEERLRLALSASRSATYEYDVVNATVLWSPEVDAMFNLEPGETPVSVDGLVAYLPPADGARLRNVVRGASMAPSQGAVEINAPHSNGTTRWFSITYLSRADVAGVVRRVVGTVTDISERKKLEEQFLHAQKMQAMGALAGGVAHDFNNLLTVIMGAGQMARASADAPGVPESVRVDLDEVLAAGERASVLTGQLLAFSRRQVVQPRLLDACDVVGGMGTMLRRLVGERIRVETALPGTKVPVYADQGQLTQVVMNLAVNARDAMPDGGTLRIGLRTGDAPTGEGLPGESLTARRFAILSVADSGAGISPDIIERIFDPFFTTKPVGQGTGLGLSTVFGIVGQLGGTVRVASTVGQGATFDVYIPLSSRERDSGAVPVVTVAATSPTGHTLLLAEDEPGLRRIVNRTLTGAGYELIMAEDGAAALTAARAHQGPIDLLVTDVVMPNLGGLELASALLRERPETRVLFMSGYPQSIGEDGPISLADAVFVAKPFKPADLLAAVRRALADG